MHTAAGSSLEHLWNFAPRAPVVASPEMPGCFNTGLMMFHPSTERRLKYERLLQPLRGGTTTVRPVRPRQGAHTALRPRTRYCASLVWCTLLTASAVCALRVVQVRRCDSAWRNLTDQSYLNVVYGHVAHGRNYRGRLGNYWVANQGLKAEIVLTRAMRSSCHNTACVLSCSPSGVHIHCMCGS